MSTPERSEQGLRIAVLPAVSAAAMRVSFFVLGETDRQALNIEIVEPMLRTLTGRPPLGLRHMRLSISEVHAILQRPSSASGGARSGFAGAAT